MIYVCIIILNILLILSIFIKITMHFRYEIIGVNIIKSYISITIFRFTIYRKQNKNSICNILSAYINNNRKKEKKINAEVQDAKDIFRQIIKQITKEKININIKLGLENSILPIYLIPTLSTIFSLYLVNNIKEKYVKNIHYNIYPEYFHTYILIDAVIKFRLLALIKVFYLKNKYKEEKNGKSSN